METGLISDHPLWYPVVESNHCLKVRSFLSYTLYEPGIKLVIGRRLERRTRSSKPRMFPLHYPLIKLVRNRRIELRPQLSRSWRRPLPQFLIGQRGQNRTVSTNIRGSEATITPRTDKLLWCQLGESNASPRCFKPVQRPLLLSPRIDIRLGPG